MTRDTHQSLIVRSTVALTAILLLAITNMVVSYLAALSTENDASRINLAGSLRMQAYRVAKAVILESHHQQSGQRSTLITSINTFENKFTHPVLYNYVYRSNNLNLTNSYQEIEHKWYALKPELLSPGDKQQALLHDIDTFVDLLDQLVSQLVLQTENKFKFLQLVQVISFLMATVIVSAGLMHLYNRMVLPLQALVAMATRVREHDFTMRLASNGNDELSMLATTFNEMIDSLDETYHQLEDKVKEKTIHLQKAQKGLQLLYDTSRHLTYEHDLHHQLKKTVTQICHYLDIDCVDIFLALGNEKPLERISSNFSYPVNSASLLTSEKAVNNTQRVFPLYQGDHKFGVLVLSCNKPLILDNEQTDVVDALIDTITTAMTRDKRIDQQHRLALMEERTAIARELHDSLAQSLSYTKIQISRLQMLSKQDGKTDAVNDAVLEIKTGIQSAYRQLREILATFRLQLDTNGLQASLEITIQEFRHKGCIPIEFNYCTDGISLTPNEEVHVLQIVRESLSNVIRHSKADRAEVNVTVVNTQDIEVNICDNGCGFNDSIQGPNHYGKTIMNERAQILGGTLTLSNEQNGGACVTLLFTPERFEHNNSGELYHGDKRNTG